MPPRKYKKPITRARGGNRDPQQLKEVRKGRPPDISEEILADILKYIDGGNKVQHACAAAGTTRQTFENWETKAEQGKEPYVSFLGTIKKARAKAKCELVMEIGQGVPGWQGKAWVLERTDSSTFALVQKNVQSGTLKVITEDISADD